MARSSPTSRPTSIASNYSEISYTLTLIFSTLALVFLHRRFVSGPNRGDTIAVAVCCLLSALCVATGIVSFILVGSRGWGMVEAWRFAKDDSAALDRPPAEPRLGLRARAVAVGRRARAPLYDRDRVPRQPDARFDDLRDAARRRTWTTWRMGWVNLFAPYRSADGAMMGTVYINRERFSGGWPIMLPALAAALAAAGHSAWRDWSKGVEPIVAVFILGPLLAGLIISVLSVPGRPDLQLTATRYTFTQALVTAIAVGVAHRLLVERCREGEQARRRRRGVRRRHAAAGRRPQPGGPLARRRERRGARAAGLSPDRKPRGPRLVVDLPAGARQGRLGLAATATAP